MKKSLILTILLLAGCASNDQMVKATFCLSIESGTFPTKGIAADIAATIPASVPLTLTNTATSAVYNVNTGESITLPIGTYSVAGTYNPTLLQGIVGTTRFTSRTPKIVVSDEVSVEAGTESYIVSASYQSFAVGVLPSEVSAWTGRFKGNIAAVEYNEGDDLHWIFVTGNIDPSNYFYTTITPISGSERTFTFITSGELEGAVLAEYGKWYIMHPAAPTTQSGSFTLDLPTWQEGNL